MIKRPTGEETEEDILKLQKEYLSQKNKKPSASVKRVSTKVAGSQQDVSKVTSEAASKEKQRFEISVEDLENASKRLDDEDRKSHVSILSGIKEKDISDIPQFAPKYYKNGFPSAPLLEKNLIKLNQKANAEQQQTTGKKKSLFAQQFTSTICKSSFGEEHFESQNITETIDVQSTDIQDVSSGKEKSKVKKKSLFSQKKTSFLGNNSEESDGIQNNESASSSSALSHRLNNTSTSHKTSEFSKQKEEIDKENRMVLSKMAEDEILEEQKKLLLSLDPQLVAFLRKDKSLEDDKVQTSSCNSATETKPSGESSSKSSAEEFKKTNDKRENMSKDTSSESVNKIENVEEKATKVFDPYKEFGIRTTYINMDVVEKEKLAWMKDLPKVSVQSTQVTPRFDFHGNLLAPDEDVPVTAGLHHHGVEPEMAGYTLEELFRLIRSNFPQQRVIGLEVIAKVIEKYHEHAFCGKLSADLLLQCLDAGLLFILRWSLDEQSEQIYSASLFALAKLLYIEKDQELIEKMYYSEDGHQIPSLCVYYKKKKEDMTQEELEEDRDLIDAELSQRDVIKALLQMQILPRLRYLILTQTTSDVALFNSLCILIRIAQHNKESAYEVYKCPGMISNVVYLLSNDVKKERNSSTDVAVMKLLKVLCTSGKNISANMVKSHCIDEVITNKLSSIDVKEEALFTTYTATLHLWTLLVMYGLSKELIQDLHSQVMQNIQKTCQQYSSCDDTLLASQIILVEKIVLAAEKKQVDWSIVEGYFPMLQFALKSVREEILNSGKVTHPLYLSATLRFCQQYFTSKNKTVDAAQKVTLLDDLHDFWMENIEPFLVSRFLPMLLKDARLHSNFKLFTSYSKITDNKTPNLPTYGSHQFLGGAIPSISLDSPMFFVQSLFQTFSRLIKINKKLVKKITGILKCTELVDYVKIILECQRQQRRFDVASTRIELVLFYHILSMFHQVCIVSSYGEFCEDQMDMFLNLASYLITFFHSNDTSLVCNLMRSIVFNSKIFWQENSIVGLLPGGDRTLNMLKVFVSRLHTIGEMYTQMLFRDESSKTNELSKNGSFLLPQPHGHTSIPSDWMYLPIVQLYNRSLELELAGRVISKASSEAVEVLKRGLEWVVLLEMIRPSLLEDVNEILRFTRFTCIFLTEGNIYKEDGIEKLVTALMSVYSYNSFICYLDLEASIPGVTSFYDLYSALLTEYTASSFADHTFANVLLIPVQVCFDVRYRRSVWTEHAEVLRVFPLPLDKVTCDVRSFLAVEQDDFQMVKIYFQMLISAAVGYQFCPIFYVIAIHHVSQFIFNTVQVGNEQGRTNIDEDRVMVENQKLAMIKKLVGMSETTTRDDVIYYKCYSLQSERGIERFTQLPPSRELRLRNRFKNENTKTDT